MAVLTDVMWTCRYPTVFTIVENADGPGGDGNGNDASIENGKAKNMKRKESLYRAS